MRSEEPAKAIPSCDENVSYHDWGSGSAHSLRAAASPSYAHRERVAISGTDNYERSHHAHGHGAWHDASAGASSDHS
ncbi:hypothetical protein TSACC_212 [Terrimicrobium sacchariphilum]|jgi:hypothetical protein|uniref:Uncharacterized protein n=1 Tax=Terrimicrobium sacchariphilum TaxID=690879 RepID=A0A146G446_TERSA|nr:hypothetical protein TSACC_212 [Terrimicrobium sacchariphilum]